MVMIPAVAMRFAAAIALVLVTGAVRPASSAEEATVRAFAVWEAAGALVQTGVDTATFAGALEGPYYIDGDKGPLAAGTMTCLVAVTISLEDGTQSGSGRCVFAHWDGARMFAEISCTGGHFVGCRGDLTLTGGDGRFAGITGGALAIIRSDFATVAKASAEGSIQTGTGILYLPAVHYAIP
ncbi:MAG: hypothetical protein ACRDGM_17665 [bacterium]